MFTLGMCVHVADVDIHPFLWCFFQCVFFTFFTRSFYITYCVLVYLMVQPLKIQYKTLVSLTMTNYMYIQEIAF